MVDAHQPVREPAPHDPADREPSALHVGEGLRRLRHAPADEIHELGLKEVSRIEVEARRVAQNLGYADLPALAAAVAKNPKLHFGSKKAVLEAYQRYVDQMYPKEVGFYQDPYSYYGHLQEEMLRAIRLVVDTGFHSKKWTRQQVIDFFHAHSTIDEVEVQSETDRYIAIPGQALGYKLGQLRILELRERAKKELGAKFDIREFHDAVLGTGALPLDVLGEQVDRWIAKRRS